MEYAHVLHAAHSHTAVRNQTEVTEVNSSSNLKSEA